MRDMTVMQSCPRWESCNAAYCPAYGGAHLPGEPVCFWLREWAKAGGPERVADALGTNEFLVGAIRAGYESIVPDGANQASADNELRRQLADSARTGSRLEAGHKLGIARQRARKASRSAIST